MTFKIIVIAAGIAWVIAFIANFDIVVSRSRSPIWLTLLNIIACLGSIVYCIFMFVKS